MKRILKYIGIVVVTLVAVAYILLSQIRFEKEVYRAAGLPSLSSDLAERIDIETSNIDSPEEIVYYSCDLACELLKFTDKNDIPNGKANCIGYAQLTSSIINRIFKSKGIKYRATPVVGQVYCLGVNLTSLSQKMLPRKSRAFFKDHDFVEIDLGDSLIFTDSSLQDLTGKRFYFLNQK